MDARELKPRGALADTPEAAEAVRQHARRQFAPVAAEYVSSESHAKGASLARMTELAPPRPTDRVLDVATGAGHAAFAYAPHVAEVIASDITPEMLALVEQGAAERGLANVRTRGDALAEALPFADAEFDKVLCRVAPHHFANVRRFLDESRRVLKPRGVLVLCDTISPDDDPETDAWLDAVERRRDPSHVRDWSAAEWVRMASDAGFVIEAVDAASCRAEQSFLDWTRRMRCSAETVASLSAAFAASPTRAREFLRILPVEGEQRFQFAFPQIVAVFRNP
jgi:ubiquinone/menaquinone biosynthesis C-methylase UbiE